MNALPQIDFEFYKSLKSAVSKRLYRFLDKRFYRGHRLEFDLRVFCCEHIGLSKKYHTGELKRALSEALSELETVGYIAPAKENGRFVQKARGEWSIVLSRASKSAARLAETSPLVQKLVDRGLSAASARLIVARTDHAKVEEKISLVDWLSARNDSRVQKNPAGFLYRAITEDFSLPDDYRAANRPKEKPRAKVVSINRGSTIPQAIPSLGDRNAIDSFWNALPVEERSRLEEDLVRDAPVFLRQNYEDGRRERGPLFQVVRQSIIDGHVKKILSQPAAK